MNKLKSTKIKINKKNKDLYKELGLEGIFKQYEEESYTRLTEMIQSYDSKLISPQVFISFMNKIYKRTK